MGALAPLKTARWHQGSGSSSQPSQAGRPPFYLLGIVWVRQNRKDDLNRSRLPLFRQRGATVSLTTRLSAKRGQGGFIFIGRFVEAIREMLIRWDILSILLLI